VPSKSEIQKQIDALTSQLDDADDDDEFDIEIWDSSGNGARVPYRKGKDWFEKTFGVNLGGDQSGDSGKTSARKTASGSKSAPGKGDSDTGGDTEGNGPAVLRHLRQSSGR
jgi:hypothetical protein